MCVLGRINSFLKCCVPFSRNSMSSSKNFYIGVPQCSCRITWHMFNVKIDCLKVFKLSPNISLTPLSFYFQSSYEGTTEKFSNQRFFTLVWILTLKCMSTLIWTRFEDSKYTQSRARSISGKFALSNATNGFVLW